MTNYFNLINPDISSIIISYVNYNDIYPYKDILNLNYNLLFVVKFPKLYHKSNFDIKELYLDLLKMVYMYPDFINTSKTITNLINRQRSNLIINTIKEQHKIGKINLEYKYMDYIEQLNKNTIKYLILNGEISIDIRYIALTDDVKLFMDNFNILKLDVDYYYYFMMYNSINILDYIFNDPYFKSQLEHIKIVLNDTLKHSYSYTYIKIDTTKLLIKNLNLNNDDLMDILYNYYKYANLEQLDTFYYILDLINPNSDSIINLLLKSFYEIIDSLYIMLNYIYNKFNYLFNTLDMIKLYSGLIDKIANLRINSNQDLLKFMILIARDKRLDNYST